MSRPGEFSAAGSLCASCGAIGWLVDKDPDMTPHLPDAWPILVCPNGHVSWLWRDGDDVMRWHNYLRVSRWDR